MNCQSLGATSKLKNNHDMCAHVGGMRMADGESVYCGLSGTSALHHTNWPGQLSLCKTSRNGASPLTLRQRNAICLASARVFERKANIGTGPPTTSILACRPSVYAIQTKPNGTNRQMNSFRKTADKRH